MADPCQVCGTSPIPACIRCRQEALAWRERLLAQMDQRVGDLLAQADEHAAAAARHMQRAAQSQIAYTAAMDQALAAWDTAIARYDEYLRRYDPAGWRREQALRDPAAEAARGNRQIRQQALDALWRLDRTEAGP